MPKSSQVWTKLATISVGLIGTVLVTQLVHFGVLTPVESLGVDFRFRHFSSATDSGRISLVAIDDGSLASIGEWPWPRQYIAQIVDLIRELGGKFLVVDLIYSKPQVKPTGGLNEISPDDKSLADAFRRYGNVILSCHFSKLENERAVEVLTENITLSPEELAERTRLPRDEISLRFPGIRRYASRRVAVHALQEQPDLTEAQFLQKVLKGDWFSLTDTRRELREAYGYAKAYRLISDRAGFVTHGPLPNDVMDFPPAGTMVVPIVPLAESAGDIGFVDFKGGADAKIRQIPALAFYEGRVYCQLALASVVRYLGATADIEITSDRLIRLSPSDRTIPPVDIPVNADGSVTIDWYYPVKDKWEKSFGDIIPAAKLLDVARTREALEQNRLKLDKAIEQTIARFMPLRHETYVKLRDRLESLERAYQDNPSSSATTEGLEPTTSTSPSVTSPDSQSASLGGSLETLLAQTRDELNNLIEQGKEQLQWLHSDEVMKLSGEQQMQTEEVLFVRDVWPFVFEKDKVRKVNAELEGSIDSALETLRRKIEGKIVLLGCTASDLGDFVPTPVFERCPGVLVHANVINQILQRSFFTHSQRNTDMLVILAMGMLVSLITTQRSAMEALGWMVVLLTGFFLVNCYFLFEKLHVISLLVGPMIAVFLSWSGVTLYRQITEGRAKRQFASRLSQYTSPALARQITENPGSLVLTPEQRHVSCFFSDLAGFTPMSEQLGAQQTVRLLNVYLEHMSECLDDYEAFINKFQGDGIFAFFNPPLHPQVDHARRACLAALACQEHLPHVQEHLEEQEFSLPSPLKMRIGISTGAVVVGDCGSTRKFDYTCLGDTVNLASRLETANKFFATKIMIDEATYRQMGDDLTARMLGKIRVVGREQSVVVYELIGRCEDQIERAAFITGFEKLILAYWQRDFNEMRACLKSLQEMPEGHDDQPLRIYQTLLNRIETEGDDIYRDGVIEMETK